MVRAARSKQPAHLVETSYGVDSGPATTIWVTDDRGRTSVLNDARKSDLDYPRDRLDNLHLGPVSLSTCGRSQQQEGHAIVLTECSPSAQLWPPKSRSYRSVNLGVLSLLTVERDCGFRSPLVDRPDLQGLTPARAAEIEKVDNRRVRVIGQDGACNGLTYDLAYRRTNLYIQDGKVAWAQMG